MVWSALATRSIYLITASLAVRFIVSKTRFINIRKTHKPLRWRRPRKEINVTKQKIATTTKNVIKSRVL